MTVVYFVFNKPILLLPGQETAGGILLHDPDVVPESSATGQEAAGVGPGPHTAGLHQKGGRIALSYAPA